MVVFFKGPIIERFNKKAGFRNRRWFTCAYYGITTESDDLSFGLRVHIMV